MASKGHARSLLAVLTALTTPIFTDLQCPHRNETITKDQHFADHRAQSHHTASLTDIIDMLKDEDEAIFSVGSELKN